MPEFFSHTELMQEGTELFCNVPTFSRVKKNHRTDVVA